MGLSTFRMQGADTTTHSAAWEKTKAVASAAATLYTVRVYSKSATDFYLQVHDSATLPTDLTTLVAVYPCNAGMYTGDEFGSGLPIANGIYLVASSSQTAVTQIGASDAWFNCGWTAR